MKSWQLKKGAISLDDLTMVQRDAPAPAAGEVLIRVRACSLNYRDSLIPKGVYMGGVVDQDIMPLSDGVGEIEALGAGLGGFNGEIALIGVLSPEGNVTPRDMMLKAGRIRGAFVGSAAMARSLSAAIDANGIKPVVDRVFGFDDAKAAYAYHASPAVFGKTVIAI
jgi:NADPH:quinone reductase-like Zn-dependent oxidoreductase